MGSINKFSFGFHQLNFSDEYDSIFYSPPGKEIILCVLSILICIFGLVGNGIFLWLLAFCIKRYSFATYLLNFTVASFGFLLVLFSIYVCIFLHYIHVHIDTYYVDVFFLQLLLLVHNSGQFILTVISIDRCVFVLHPAWYLCHKSPNFPTFMCSLIWALSFLIFGLHLTNLTSEISILLCWVLGPFLICFLVVTLSTVTLFVKVCLKSQPQQRGALITAILGTLLLFLLVDVFAIIITFYVYTYSKSLYILLGKALASSINPLIYFLAERWKNNRLQESMRVILRRVFKEEDPPLPDHIQLQALH